MAIGGIFVNQIRALRNWYVSEKRKSVQNMLSKKEEILDEEI